MSQRFSPSFFQFFGMDRNSAFVYGCFRFSSFGEKRVEIGLTYIYGIGLSTSQKILAETGVNPDTRVKDLTEEEVNAIRNFVKNITVDET